MYTVSVVVKVNALRCDVRVKGVLVEHDSAYGDRSIVKVVREGHVLRVLNRCLKRNHVPFSSNVFFNGTSSASSTS